MIQISGVGPTVIVVFPTSCLYKLVLENKGLVYWVLGNA